MADIPMQTRLTLNALLDRLVADGDVFDRADAQELINLLPLSPRSSPFQFLLSWTGSSTRRGAAPGHGDVSIKDEEDKSFALGRDRRWRIGGYKVGHEPGAIEIARMWDDTRIGVDEKICRLIYDYGSRLPQAMELSRERPFALGPLVFISRTFDLWKTPA